MFSVIFKGSSALKSSKRGTISRISHGLTPKRRNAEVPCLGSKTVSVYSLVELKNICAKGSCIIIANGLSFSFTYSTIFILDYLIKLIKVPTTG